MHLCVANFVVHLCYANCVTHASESRRVAGPFEYHFLFRPFLGHGWKISKDVELTEGMALSGRQGTQWMGQTHV
jgi:hypothetical protein